MASFASDTLLELFNAALLLVLVAGVLPLLAVRQRRVAQFSYMLSALGCFILFLFSIFALTSGQILHAEASGFFSPLDSLTFYIDSLSAYFCLILGLIGTVISIYSVRYSEHYSEELPGVLAGLSGFVILAMAAVFTADNTFQFLVSWEAMSFFAFFLVAYEYKKEQAVRAAGTYIGMTHFGSLFLIALFVLLYKFTGSALLSEVQTSVYKIPKGTLNFMFLAALVGFGTKAGIFPLHIWLPSAHPVAPSNVSALMSGVLIKTGVYGFLRIMLQFNGVIEIWWALLILGVGAISAILGILYALMEHDIKRLLAYCSIENIGIILMGIAMSMLFWHFHLAALAGFALTAALFHTLNHAIFKTALFLGAGSIHRSVHLRDMEKLGGLIKLMPYTAFAFLIAAMSISAIPPFSGFVSEWMTFVSIIQVNLIQNTPDVIRITVPVVGAVLALTSALAAACFVKAFGITFLGTPRSPQIFKASESPLSMTLPILFLALLCISLGLFPSLILTLTNGIREAFFGNGAFVPYGFDFISAPDGSSSISMSYISVGLLCFSVVAAIFTHLFGKGRQTQDLTWACGGRAEGRQQYTATGFAKPIRMIFRGLYQPRSDLSVTTGENRYHIKSTHYSGGIQNIFERFFYTPLFDGIQSLSQLLLRLQETSINAYLAYVLGLFILLLLIGGGSL